MWLHGVGWFLPLKMDNAWITVHRDAAFHTAGFLEPCRTPPLYLGDDRCFRQLLLVHDALPHGPPPTTNQLARRQLPPTGLALWPGHCLHLTLRVPWPAALPPTTSHWPLDRWTPYLSTWHMHACPTHTFLWKRSPWLPSSPIAFYPTKVHYHPVSGQAEWSFCLQER